MKKQCFVDKENHEIVCTCFPATPNEVSKWYDVERGLSIALYGKLIDNVTQYVGSNDIKLISCFTFHDKPNLLTQKKGMKGVFSKFNMTYQSAFESLSEINGKISFVSIAQAPLQHLSAFLLHRYKALSA